jgi:hypothetical protein
MRLVTRTLRSRNAQFLLFPSSDRISLLGTRAAKNDATLPFFGPREFSKRARAHRRRWLHVPKRLNQSIGQGLSTSLTEHLSRTKITPAFHMARSLFFLREGEREEEGSM